MKSISYPITLSTTHTLKISAILGAAAETYHVFIDNFFIGSVIRVRGELVPHIRELAGDDIGALVEVIEAEFGE